MRIDVVKIFNEVKYAIIENIFVKSNNFLVAGYAKAIFLVILTNGCCSIRINSLYFITKIFEVSWTLPSTNLICL